MQLKGDTVLTKVSDWLRNNGQVTFERGREGKGWTPSMRRGGEAQESWCAGAVDRTGILGRFHLHIKSPPLGMFFGMKMRGKVGERSVGGGHPVSDQSRISLNRSAFALWSGLPSPRKVMDSQEAVSPGAVPKVPDCLNVCLSFYSF